MRLSISKINFFLFLFIFFIFLFSPQKYIQGQWEDPISPVTSIGDVYRVLNNILRYIYTLFFILAAIFIVLAGFTYLTAGGDANKVKEAKSRLTYAIIAIVIALIAVGVRSIIMSIIT